MAQHDIEHALDVFYRLWQIKLPSCAHTFLDAPRIRRFYVIYDFLSVRLVNNPEIAAPQRKSLFTFVPANSRSIFFLRAAKETEKCVNRKRLKVEKSPAVVKDSAFHDRSEKALKSTERRLNFHLGINLGHEKSFSVEVEESNAAGLAWRINYVRMTTAVKYFNSSQHQAPENSSFFHPQKVGKSFSPHASR